MTTLQSWLRKNGVTHMELAHRLGVDKSTVYLWITHQRYPRTDMAVAIEQITGGEVPAGSWTFARIAAHARIRPEKVASAYRGGRVRPKDLERIEKTARALHLVLPPPSPTSTRAAIIDGLHAKPSRARRF